MRRLRLVSRKRRTTGGARVVLHELETFLSFLLVYAFSRKNGANSLLLDDLGLAYAIIRPRVIVDYRRS